MIKRLAVCLILGLLADVVYGQKTFKGNASYYSDKLQGRRMSNGKPYHRDSMTCAHRKLPFGTKLKVKNPKNGKEVVVEVSDRGPFSKKFIIDLSRAAARQLDILAAGYAMMEITVLPMVGIPYRDLGEEKPALPLLDLDEPPAYFFENER